MPKFAEELSFSDTDIGVSPFDSATAVKTGFQTAQRHIDELEYKICNWNQRFNTLSLSIRLPAEVMSMVFEWATLGQDAPEFNLKAKGTSRQNKDQEINRGRYNPVCLRLSQVCSRWRSIALGCPSLWSHISSQNRDLVALMHHRSKLAPLDIAVHLKSPETMDGSTATAFSLVSNISRIYSLSFTHDNTTGLVDARLSDELGQPAPLLECLTICRLNPGHTTIRLPKDIFACHAPRLRELKLHGYALNMESTFGFNSLSSLTIDKSNDAPLLHKFVPVLGNMVRLETLDLSGTLPHFNDDVLNPPNLELNICLPLLRKIYLRSTVSEATHFLSQIACPAIESIGLKMVHDYCRYSHQLDFLLRRLSETLRGMQQLPIRCLHLKQGKGAILDAGDVPCTFSSACQWGDTSHGKKFSISINISTFPGMTPLDEKDKQLILMWLCGYLSLKDLDSLYLDQGFDLEIGRWSILSNDFQKVKTLSSLSSFPKGVMHLISTPISAVNPGSEPIFHFPALSRLAIGWVKDDIDGDGERSYFSELMGCLQRRGNVSELYLDPYCQISEESVLELKQVVGKVKIR